MFFLGLKSINDNDSVGFFNFKDQTALEVLGWEFFVGFLVTFTYIMLTINGKSERNIYAVGIGAIYGVIIIAFTNLYYSRYNFLLGIV